MAVAEAEKQLRTVHTARYGSYKYNSCQRVSQRVNTSTRAFDPFLSRRRPRRGGGRSTTHRIGRPPARVSLNSASGKMSPAKPQTVPYRYRIATGRLAELAAVTSPPSSCELHHGDTLDATLRRQCLDLARRNLQGFAIWDGAGKREELCHEDTRVVALRQGGGLLGYATYRLTKEEGVDVAYLYELHLEERARGLRYALTQTPHSRTIAQAPWARPAIPARHNVCSPAAREASKPTD